MKLAPPVIPTSLEGGGRIVTRVETVAKGANVDAVVTDSGVRRRDGRVASLGGVVIHTRPRRQPPMNVSP
jgi:hypothetical protein